MIGPARGRISSGGTAAQKVTSAYCVVEAVLWKIQTPRANAVSPEPTSETNCPDQTKRKLRTPACLKSDVMPSPRVRRRGASGLRIGENGEGSEPVRDDEPHASLRCLEGLVERGVRDHPHALHDVRRQARDEAHAV